MDIRTQLALILVFVSLLSMVLLGAFAYQTASELLKETSIRQLDALAESKARNLSKVQKGWKEQLEALIAEEELRSVILAFLAGEAGAMSRFVHLVEHSAGAVRNVERIEVTGLKDNTLIWGDQSDYGDVKLPEKLGEIGFGGAFRDEEGGLKIILSALLPFGDLITGSSRLVSGDSEGDQAIGLEVVFDAKDIDAITADHTGLGDTGEVMVVALRENDSIMVLNALRHDGSLAPQEFPMNQTSEAIRQVLSGKSVVMEGFDDYRGEKAWAATRYLPDLKWGIVVKVDASEEEEPADELMGSMFDIGIALSAFAIIGGTLLGFYLARPIHELAVLVGRIRQGETSLRAPVGGDDEIAYLGESLNELLDHMQTDDSSVNPHRNA